MSLAGSSGSRKMLPVFLKAGIGGSALLGLRSSELVQPLL